MRAVIIASSMLLVGMLVQTVSAERLASYDLVGEDPAGDSIQPFATGVNWPQCNTGFGCTKYDLVALDMGADATSVHFQMRLANHYWGTTSALYVIHFNVGETSYYTCWNINSVGLSGAGQYSDVTEEMTSLACTTRFPGETRVGPTTRAGGTDVGEGDGMFWVRWEVPKEAIEDPSLITDIVMEVWARSANPTYAPATAPQALYVWNRADRAPDEGAWTYTLGGAASAVQVNLTVAPANATVAPGGNVSANVSAALNGTGPVEFNLTASGQPEGWNVTFSEPNGTLIDASPLNSTITVSVPANASEGAYNLTIELTGANNVTAASTFTVTVLKAVAPTPTASSNATGPPSESIVAHFDESATPGPGALFSVAAVLAAAVVGRRRR